MHTNKLTMKLKTGYSFGIMGESIIVNLFTMFYLLFLTDAAGITPAVAGTVATIITFWGAIADVIAGNISDKSKNPKGKRRPFMVKAAVPLALVFILMYMDVGFLPENLVAIYFVVIGIVGWQIFSFFNIPFLSLGAELSANYDERNSIRSITNVINGLGFLVVASGTIILLGIFAPEEVFTSSSAWVKVAIVFAVVMTVGMMISIVSTKGREQVVETIEDAPKIKFGKTVKELFKNKSFVILMLFTLFGYGGAMIYSSSFIYYFTYVQGYTVETTTTLTTLFAILVIAFSALVGKIASKFEKKVVLAIGGFAATIAFALVFFAELSLGVFAGGIMVVFLAIFNSSYFVVAYSMLFDICTIDAFKSGEDRAGTVISLFNFLNKVVGGIALFVIGWALEITKYDPTLLEQADETKMGISMVSALIPAIMFLIAAVVVSRYRVNRNNFNALQEAASKREDGKEYSTDGFKELI